MGFGHGAGKGGGAMAGSARHHDRTMSARKDRRDECMRELLPSIIPAQRRVLTISLISTGRLIASTIVAATSAGSMNSGRGFGQNGVFIPPGAAAMIRTFVPLASAFSAS